MYVYEGPYQHPGAGHAHSGKPPRRERCDVTAATPIISITTTTTNNDD